MGFFSMIIPSPDATGQYRSQRSEAVTCHWWRCWNHNRCIEAAGSQGPRAETQSLRRSVRKLNTQDRISRSIPQKRPPLLMQLLDETAMNKLPEMTSDDG